MRSSPRASWLAKYAFSDVIVALLSGEETSPCGGGTTACGANSRQPQSMRCSISIAPPIIAISNSSGTPTIIARIARQLRYTRTNAMMIATSALLSAEIAKSPSFPASTG